MSITDASTPTPETAVRPTEDPTVVVNNFDATEGALSSLPEIVEESKAGVKTTEFWTMIATQIALLTDTAPVPEDTKGLIMAAVAIGYAIARAIAKKGIPKVTT